MTYAPSSIRPALASLAVVCGLACLCARQAVAATINAASASYADVLTAYNAASDGDTVAIPAGNVGWSSALTVAKNVTIKGAGRTLTIITNTNPVNIWGSEGSTIFYVSSGATPRISSMTLDGNWTTGHANGGNAIVCVGSGATRVDNCLIKNCFPRAIYAAIHNYTKGLVDHTTFENNYIDISVNSDNQTAWTRPVGLGSTNQWVVEDSYSAKTRNDRLIPVMGDGLWGARYTYRYNTLSNLVNTSFDQVIDAHGNQGGPLIGSANSARGVVAFESYGNLWFVRYGNRISHLRGGTQIHYNNQIFSESGNLDTYGLAYQLTEEDGYRVGNPIRVEWPGWDQITNSWFFNNTINGGTSDFLAPGGVFLQWAGTTPCPSPTCSQCQCPPYPASDGIFIQNGRDFQVDQIPDPADYTPLAYPHPRIVAENDPPIPPQFAMLSPANGATGVSAQPTLSWADTSGETGYRVMLGSNPYFAPTIVDTTVAAGTTSYAVPGGLLSQPVTYYWRVWASSANGDQSATQQYRTFTTGSGGSPGSIQLSASTYAGDEDGGVIVVTAQRAGGSTGAVSVQYATANITATAGTDYVAASGTLNWGDGDAANKTFNITPIDNGSHTGDLTLSVTLSSPGGGATLGSPASATVTVTDTDSPPVDIPLMTSWTFKASLGRIRSPGLTNASGWFYHPTENLNPATAGLAEYRFSITNAANYQMRWMVNGTGTDRNSFVVAIDDETPDVPQNVFGFAVTGAGMEQRYVSWIGNGTALPQYPTNTWGLTPGEHTLRIWGYEWLSYVDEITIEPAPVPSGTLQFSVSTYAANEDAGTVTLTVRRVDGDGGAVGVSYATANGTATAGVNYTAKSGTLNWADSDTADKSIVITLLDDGVYAADKTFTVTLSSATGGASLGTPTQATVTVFNTDPEPVPGTLALSSSVYSGNEDGPAVTVTVRRTVGSDGAVGVNYSTSNGTAMAGVNYTTTTGTLSWSNGDAADKTFTISLLDDGVYGPDLGFTVNLSSATGGASLGLSSATVTVLNTDPPPDPEVPGTISLSSATYSQNEDAPTVTITLRRTAGSDGEVGVNYATSDGTATDGVNYTDTSGTATWTDSDVADKTFTVPLIDDGVYGPDLTFTVTLSGITGGATLGTPNSASVTVLNTDPMPTPGVVQFATSVQSVNETAGTVTVTLRRVNGNSGSGFVTWATQPITAVDGVNFTGDTDTQAWGAGDAADKTFPVTILADGADTANLTFRVILSSPSGVALGSPTTNTITILDSDLPPTPPPTQLLGWSSPGFRVEEGSKIFAVVLRYNGTSGTISANYSTVNGTAIGGVDFTPVAGTITLLDGESGGIIEVQTTQNSVREADKSFNLLLSNPVGGGISDAQTQCVISEDDINPNAPGNVIIRQGTFRNVIFR